MRLKASELIAVALEFRIQKHLVKARACRTGTEYRKVEKYQTGLANSCNGVFWFFK